MLFLLDKLQMQSVVKQLSWLSQMIGVTVKLADIIIIKVYNRNK